MCDSCYTPPFIFGLLVKSKATESKAKSKQQKGINKQPVCSVPGKSLAWLKEKTLTGKLPPSVSRAAETNSSKYPYSEQPFSNADTRLRHGEKMGSSDFPEEFKVVHGPQLTDATVCASVFVCFC